MTEDDRWPIWFRRRWPFTRRWFDDFDDFFKDMEQFMERQFKEVSKTAPKDLVRERTLPDGRKVKEWGPFVYGYSVKIGSDGKPHIREFGNVKPETRRGGPQINIKEQREPLIDTLETDGELKVIAELPGVDKKDIVLHGTEDNLSISVNTPQRKYYKDVVLPTKVDPKLARSTYKNGVLEITLQKKREEKPKGESIRID